MKAPLSLGFFGLFGRSPVLREFDTALRSVDLHPKLVPEAIKLTAMKMLMEQTGRDDPGVAAMRSAAEIIAYCIIGADAFAGTNTVRLADDIEQRIDAALATGTNLDAKLVLLALHARVIQQSVVDHFKLEVVSD
ncbi:MAG: hypothetical protein QNK17_10685 [Hyphomicrobiaceae bacterium]|nr:hypothetical protein [Hyphomicrobiaceae bacterium]MDX2450875.1 hypothetical protein [Hyphomicrobiaceae bacterium]